VFQICIKFILQSESEGLLKTGLARGF